MRIPSIFLFSFFLFISVSQAGTFEWKEMSGDHFIVYFAQDEDFVKEVLNKAEEYYKQIASDLGYARYSGFWTWDNRVKIYIYPNRESFVKNTNQPEWSEGLADYKNKSIISYAWNKGFVESLLPHEMTHLIFRDFVGFKGEVPLWLDEGVAQWEEQLKRDNVRMVARKMYHDDALFSIEDMMKLDVRSMTDKNQIYIRSVKIKDGTRRVLLLSLDNLVSTYYIESVAIVDFLISKYGSDSFVDFCRELRDGKSLEEALRFAYSSRVRNLNELEDGMRNYLEEG